MTDIVFEAKLVQDITAKAFFRKDGDDSRENSHRWSVTVNGQQFDYYTGCAHRTPRYGRSPRLYGQNFRRLWEAQEWINRSRPTKPSLDDVLYSLLIDAEAHDQSFEDWCSNFGYDTDSRKALATYMACQETATKLRRAKIDLEFHRERLQDY